MSKEESVEKFRFRFQNLWKVIKEGESDEGFIRNVIDRLLPFFQEDSATKKMIEDWKDLSGKDSNLFYRAYKELSWTVEEIRKHSEGDSSTLQQLEGILEEVRKEGSCAFLKEIPYPYDVSYYKLRTLYVNKVSK